MEIDQVIITLGINKLREVKIELKYYNETLATGIGWTFSQAQADLSKNYPNIKDNYDLMNMLKY